MDWRFNTYISGAHIFVTARRDLIKISRGQKAGRSNVHTKDPQY
jgi:hypothetical protein